MPHDDEHDDEHDYEHDYEVGYGKPPPHTRLVKGQSGNRRGRAPDAKNMKTLLTKALNELVIVTDNGGGVGEAELELRVGELRGRQSHLIDT